jgi:hypothetical protein
MCPPEPRPPMCSHSMSQIVGIENAVPEASTWAMMLIGFAGLEPSRKYCRSGIERIRIAGVLIDAQTVGRSAFRASRTYCGHSELFQLLI